MDPPTSKQQHKPLLVLLKTVCLCYIRLPTTLLYSTTMGDENVDNAFEFGAITSQVLYAKLHFKNPDSLYDKPAPDVFVTMTIAAVLVLTMMIMWCFRYH